MPKSRGRGSAGNRSTLQRMVVPSSGVGTRRSSRCSPATDQRSDVLSPADCPPNRPPSRSVADLSLEQLMEAVGNRVRQEMRAQSTTLYQPPHAQFLLVTPYQPQLTRQRPHASHHSRCCRRPLASLQPPISLPTLYLHPVSPFFSLQLVLRSFSGFWIVSVASIVYSQCWYGSLLSNLFCVIDQSTEIAYSLCM